MTTTSRVPGPRFQIYSMGVTEVFRWRLLSANNRDLCRGGRQYPDEMSCRQAIVGLLRHVCVLDAAITRTSDDRWRWQLAHRADVLVFSAHSYDRRIRCDLARKKFVDFAATVPATSIPETPVEFVSRSPAVGFDVPGVPSLILVPCTSPARVVTERVRRDPDRP